MRIVRASDQSVIFQTDEQPFQLQDIDSHHNVISRINNIAFQAPGKYWLEVLLDGDLCLNYPILLKEEKNEPHR